MPTENQPLQSHHLKPAHVVTTLADEKTPAALFQALSQQTLQAFLLESSDGDKRFARYSLIGALPKLRATLKDCAWQITDRDSGHTETVLIAKTDKNPLKTLATLQQKLPIRLPDGLDLPFSGGWVGYWGYGLTRYFDGIIPQSEDPLAVSDADLGYYDAVIVYDHLKRQIHWVGFDLEPLKRLLEEIPLNPVSLKPLEIPAVGRIQNNIDALYQGVSVSMGKDAFLQTVSKAKTLIETGEIFQIVLSQRFFLPVIGPVFDVYRMLQSVNPSPYAYYLQYPDYAYLGASPETCVSYQPNGNTGEITLRALAGTRPRAATTVDDSRLAEELLNNEKEMAEHRMLVDLARNDVGRLSRAGTVQVGEIAQLVYYTHVMHLSTEVKGTLKEGLTPYDIIPSCFPRGTVSGAPKIRAMQLLSQLETQQRGIYSGMVGYLDVCGKLDGAIAIRSALVKDGTAHIQAGAGIVYDSNPEAEYEETRNKARSVVLAVKLSNQANANPKGAQPC